MRCAVGVGKQGNINVKTYQQVQIWPDLFRLSLKKKDHLKKKKDTNKMITEQNNELDKNQITKEVTNNSKPDLSLLGI